MQFCDNSHKIVLAGAGLAASASKTLAQSAIIEGGS